MRNKLEYIFMSGDDMYVRFLHNARSANRGFQERIMYLNLKEMHRESHFVCHTEKDRIVGDLAIQQSPYDPSVIWLKHVSVDPSHRHKGIASHMLELCVSHVGRIQKTLEISSYSEDGIQFINPVVARLMERYPEISIHLPPDKHSFSSISEHKF